MIPSLQTDCFTASIVEAVPPVPGFLLDRGECPKNTPVRCENGGPLFPSGHHLLPPLQNGIAFLIARCAFFDTLETFH